SQGSSWASAGGVKTMAKSATIAWIQPIATPQAACPPQEGRRRRLPRQTLQWRRARASAAVTRARRGLRGCRLAWHGDCRKGGMTTTTTMPVTTVRYVLRLADLGARDVGSAGGKGANLGELTRAGFPVPPGFVVT